MFDIGAHKPSRFAKRVYVPGPERNPITIMVPAMCWVCTIIDVPSPSGLHAPVDGRRRRPR